MQLMDIMQNCPTVNLNNKTSGGYAFASLRAHFKFMVALNNVNVMVIQGKSLRLIGFLACY